MILVILISRKPNSYSDVEESRSKSKSCRIFCDLGIMDEISNPFYCDRPERIYALAKADKTKKLPIMTSKYKLWCR